MSQKVRVRIKAEAVVKYDQTVAMTQEQWEELKNTPRRRMEDCCMSPLSAYLNLRQTSDYGDFDDLDIGVVDENGEDVSPEDYYGQ